MSRKGITFRRSQALDPVYGSDLAEKFICSMMWEGKKSTAQRVFYGAMDQIAKKTNDDALKIFPVCSAQAEQTGGKSGLP